jgi:hypothetical protein
MTRGVISMGHGHINGVLLTPDQAAHIKVLLDNAVPREPGGTMDWEGVGRRVAESYLGFRPHCLCPQPLLEHTPHAAGCPVHDESIADARWVCTGGSWWRMDTEPAQT